MKQPCRHQGESRRRRISCSRRHAPVAHVKAMVKQIIPLQTLEDHFGADIHIAVPGGPHATVGECALKEAVVREEPTSEQAPGRN